jgi:hypothetical protein
MIVMLLFAGTCPATSTYGLGLWPTISERLRWRVRALEAELMPAVDAGEQGGLAAGAGQDRGDGKGRTRRPAVAERQLPLKMMSIWRS